MSNNPQENIRITKTFLDNLLQGVTINYLGSICVYVLFFEKSLKSLAVCIVVIALGLFAITMTSRAKLPKVTKENLCVEKLKFSLSYMSLVLVFAGFYLCALQEHYLPKVIEHNKKGQMSKEVLL